MVSSAMMPYRCLLLSLLLLWTPGLYAEMQQIPDLPVQIQTGETKQFYRDLVKDKVVVMQFIFTQCRMTCPVLGASFSHLRKNLGELAGTDVQLLSISVDPVNDTPARLQQWAKQFSSGPGWTQVTGSKQNIDQLLKALQAFSADINDHGTLLLLGNERAGVWKRLNALTPIPILETEIQQLLSLN